MKPDYLKKRINLEDTSYVKNILRDLSLHTVCEEAFCPNISECFSKKVATFLILGKICTRNCKFCDIEKGRPEELDKDEPEKVLEAVKKLRLSFVVITSVTRDDIEDGGSEIFKMCVLKIKNFDKNIKIETLIPDFKGNIKALEKVVSVSPEIISHNIETVPSLYSEIRSKANYQISLSVLKNAKELNNKIYTKSGIMLGLGEKENEVIKVMEDLHEVRCDFLSIGQYLSPSKNHYPVKEYISPEKFEYYKEKAMNSGFKYVKSGPFVRSSYLAEEYLLSNNNKIP